LLCINNNSNSNFMKNFFTLIFVFLLYSAQATNYYFSAVSGDDSRSPAQARNASTPWKTLGKLNSFFINLQPGDAVLLKRGDIFYGSIRIAKSGEPGLPIVIGAYGTGNKPVITSLVTLGRWVSKGNGVWESYNSALGTTLNTVLINDVSQEMGRYPNSNSTNKGYLTLESHTSNSITDNELHSYPNWTGAEVVIRMNRWVTDRCLITKHSGGKIMYNKVSPYTAINNFGYFIQNDIKTLDKFGEWYYNPSENKLSVYFGANTPSSYIVQAATIDNLISANGYNNIVLYNLDVKGANSDGINIKSGLNANIKNCDISFSGVNGLSVKFNTNAKIENCTVSCSNNNGIDLGYGGDYVTVRNNKITNTSVFAGMGKSGDAKGFGIYSSSKGTVIEYNQVINTGYIGIGFNGDSTIVKNNFIDSFCLTKNDGSGIYTHTGPSNINKYGRKIIGNIILNGIGAGEGTDAGNSAAEGIYLDDNSSGVEIRNNTVANMPDRGLFLNNARDLVIRDNTFYNINVGFFARQYRKIAGAAIRNLSVKQNIFFLKDNTQRAAYFTTEQDDNNLIGTLDSNYYARPIDDRMIIFNSYVNSAGSRVNEYVDLEGWKAKYGKDAASKRTAKQILPYKINSIIGSNKYANGTFSSDKRGVFVSACTASLSNGGQLDGSYLEVVPSARYSSVFIDIGELKANTKYILRYSIKGSVSDGVYIGASLRNKISPYTVLTPIENRKVNLSRSNNEIMFSSSSNLSLAQIVFTGNNQNNYYLDNIQLYEADATITNIDDSLRFVYNSTPVSNSVSLEGNYVDVKNNKYSNSIVLQPYTSAVLIKNGDIINTTPSVSIISPVSNAKFAAPASVTINAAAADSNGTISKVDFYNGNTLLGTDNTSPYTFTWNNVAAGNYSITAKATDNGSLVTASDAVTVSVYTPNVAPSVSVISPVSNARFAAPASVTINAMAADSNGTISKVDFYNGNTLLGTDNTSPYTFTWNNVVAGNYSITAKATDNGSLVTASDVVVISVYTPNVAPSISITSPVNNATFAAPASVTINAAAADNDGTISKVDFYSGDTLLGTVTKSPYTFTWNNVVAGNYSITTKATDNGSLVTASDVVVISVYTPNVAPSISIISPVNNATFAAPASVTINAAAADNDGTISKVDFYNADTLLATVSQSPYTFTWNNVAAGNYSITAKATDNGSLVTASDAVAIFVYTPNVAPSVNLTSPVATTKYIGSTTISISANAKDADGTISKVDFYNGTVLLKTILSAPYTYSWGKVAAGTYTLTAKATDNKGAVTTSDPVTITVLKNKAPAVAITSPATNTTYNSPATINISVSATDADGTISKVEIYNGTTLLRTERIVPYSYSWQNVPAGNYKIIAKATDNKGAVTTSAAVTVSVAAKNISFSAKNNTATAINNVYAFDLKAPKITKDKPEINDLKVFPNPAVSKIYVNINELLPGIKTANVNIQNLSGIVFKSIPVIISAKTIEADVSSLRTGIYIISIVHNDVIISRKFVKN